MLEREEVEKIVEVFGGTAVPGEESDIGQVYRRGANSRGAFICHPIPAEELREKLIEEGYEVDDDLWDHTLSAI